MKTKPAEILIEQTEDRLKPDGQVVPYSEFNLIQRLMEIQAELEDRNALYEEYDWIVTELARHDFVRSEIGEQVILLKDNFAKGNTAFKACGVKRFDVEVITKELEIKRKLKAEKAGKS